VKPRISCAASIGPGKDGPGYVRGCRKPDSRHRKLYRAEGAYLQLALEGHAVLSAHRQEAAGAGLEIAITFKEPPHSIFDDAEGWRENVLVIRLQPNEGMNLMVMIKEPGPGGMRLMQVPLDMSFADALGEEGTRICPTPMNG
jgi:glucose-6-phosphate 1-dehydrogenase